MSDFNLQDTTNPEDDVFGSGGGSNEKLARLGVGSEAALGASGRPKVNAQQVVLLAVLVVGGGLLYGMRKLGMGPELVIADSGITYQPRMETTAQARELERLMAALEQSAAPVQIPLDSVGRNPFEIRAVLAAREAENAGLPEAEAARAAEAARRAAEQKEEELQRDLRQFALQSTMGGNVPVARINDQFYRIGDRVGERFKLLRVEGRTVVLAIDDGREFVLTVGENQRPTSRPATPRTPRRR